ncbi:MAG: family 20 glycosylhydrolase, partial [bacterium]|nr:family 20 glycosylhydrolase [bacterium]
MIAKYWVRCVALMALVLTAGCATTKGPRPFKEDAWRGVHIYISDRDHLPLLHRAIEAMAAKGLNAVILEVSLRFDYQSHPEIVEGNPLTRDDARALKAVCDTNGVRLIPMFQCLGHQGSRPNKLLRVYPELMAPPQPDYTDPAHYHVSWNPLHPKTNEIVFALFDELIEAFDPEYFHVGMDEVFLFPDETTPYYNGENPAEVFAKAVNDYHDYLVKKKGLTMLMWGDRLLDQSVVGYHHMEASNNGTAPAIDMIPKDIIVCDWHYIRMEDYQSVPHLQEHGFRVWPSSWRSPTAALAFVESSQRHDEGKVVGHLCTMWCGLPDYCKAI